MDLQAHITDLPSQIQSKIALHLIKAAMPVWEKYASDNDLFYIDSVVGMEHQVDINLLQITVSALENKAPESDLERLRNAFADPIVALQDQDWTLPYPVSRLFYAVHNLLESRLRPDQMQVGKTRVYVAVNQAADTLRVSGLMDVEVIDQWLKKHTNYVGEHL